MNQGIPEEVRETGEKLIQAGFSAYLVGGCVRDIFLKREPKDWDIATSAAPEQIQQVFPDSVYENQFGTVGVKTRSSNPGTEVIEVTTFRQDGQYSDFRHPDQVVFAKTIEDDLARRDFTINALALDLSAILNSKFQIPNSALVDPFGGQIDLKKKLIRAVRDPQERFKEDALRLLRAVRLAIQLDFALEHETSEAIIRQADLLKKVSQERIRDEFVKILMTENAVQGLVFLEKYRLLPQILPELMAGIGIEQNHHHIYTVWEHSLRTLDYAAKKNFALVVRLAALLHDAAKPQTKRGVGKNATFYGHDTLSAKLARQALTRLKFSKDIIERVCHLIRYHMFYYNVGEVTKAGVRRFISRVGVENLDELIQLREADRIGSGVPKAQPYRLRHLLFMIDKVRQDPVSPKMLAVNGNDLMAALRIKPGPRVGWIQKLLLESVLRDPGFNQPASLLAQAENLHQKSDKELESAARQAAEISQEFEEEQEKAIRKKFFV
jgi:poly(A) polymerase/tRNA nucleotidyltransferase (CCA-adding enzyme)